VQQVFQLEMDEYHLKFAGMTSCKWLSVLVLVLTGNATLQAAPNFDTSEIETITGLKGAYNESEGAFKVSSPRTDIKVSVDQWMMSPFMGLTTWAAFASDPDPKEGGMIMGDIVLFQDEANPVMSVALDKGLEVTALHNHFFYDDPRVYFMHVGGTGQLNVLATGFRAILDKIKEIRAASPQLAQGFGGPSIPAMSSITGKPIEDIFHATGQAKDGMFKMVVGLTTKMPCGCIAGKDMGVNTWAAFAGTDDNAVVDGDFAVKETELQHVLKSLRGSGINIVAIHSHMTQEEPRILFLHYWGRGKATQLAYAVKAALSTQ
jgi:hypothetical protein